MKTILIVDDEATLRQAIRNALGRRGYATREATNSKEALKLARSWQPDLILCDIQMQGGDGYDLLRRLRESQATASIPLILMTGHADVEGVRTGMNLGADDFLPKPFPMQAMLDAVQARLAKQAILERRVEATEARLGAILEATSDLVAIWDGAGAQLLYLNAAGRRLLGVAEQADLSARHLVDFLPAWAGELVRTSGVPTATREGLWTGETAILAADGQEIPVSQVILAHRGADGSVESYSTIARDISGWRDTLKALHRSEELFRLITEQGGVLFTVVNRPGRRLYHSPSHLPLLGYVAEDLAETGLLDQVHPEDRVRVEAALAAAFASGQVPPFEYRMRTKEGTWRTLEAHGGVIRGGFGDAESVLLIARDITERRQEEAARARMQAQLHQAQKLESIGQLAAGIAHEINTPIQYVGDNTRFLQDSFRDLAQLFAACKALAGAARSGTVSPELATRLEEAWEAADVEYLQSEIPKAIAQSLEGVGRVARIVQAMKEFSHPGGEEKTLVDLNHAIESTITVARNVWKYVADLETDFDPALPLVPCLPGEINQVMLNLIVNAAHAIADVVGDGHRGKGRIRVSTRALADAVEVRVADTGTGIPEAVRGRVFDPFFTTKPVGRGTGQGLAIAHAVVVEKHGGTLTFETEWGQGTTFTVRLPLAPPPPVGPAADLRN